MDCSPSGCSVHGILQARILEWISMPSSRDRTWVSYVSCIGRQVLYHWSHLGRPSWPHEQILNIILSTQMKVEGAELGIAGKLAQKLVNRGAGLVLIQAFLSPGWPPTPHYSPMWNYRIKLNYKIILTIAHRIESPLLFLSWFYPLYSLEILTDNWRYCFLRWPHVQAPSPSACLVSSPF